MSETTLQVYEDHVLVDNDPIKRGSRRANRKSYIYPNGSEIVLGGFDEPTRLLSSEYDIIYIPEAIEVMESDFETALTRLRANNIGYRMLIMDTNPGPKTHWIWRKYEAGEIEMIFSSHQDNPYLWDGADWTEAGQDYIETLGTLQGSRRDRYLLGKWGSVEGARFPQFDRSVHVFDKRSLWNAGIPYGSTKFISCDYGLAAPYCALWHLVDFDGNVYTYREDYQRGLTADVQAARIVQLSPQAEEYFAIYLDDAMWQRFPGHLGETTISAHSLYRDAFAREDRFGPLLPGTKERDKNNALSVLDSLLNTTLARAGGEAIGGSWYIDSSCENLIRELESAMFYQTKEGVWMDKLDPNASDHAIDAAIYGLHTHLKVPVKQKPLLPTPEEVARSKKERREKDAIERLNRTTKRIRA